MKWADATNGYHSVLVDGKQKYPKPLFFTGRFQYAYLQPGGNFEKVSFATTKEKSKISIGLKNYAILETVNDLESHWKSLAGNLTLTTNRLNFVTPAFKKIVKPGGPIRKTRKEKAVEEEFQPLEIEIVNKYNETLKA